MREIPLSQGFVALVDDADFDWLNQWKWCAKKTYNNWYAVRREWPSGKMLKMHRVILGLPKGKPIVNHENGNGLDNQRHNIAPCTHSENSRAFCRKAPGCSSQFRGVTWDKARELWMTKIKLPHKHLMVGRFKLEVDAALAYNTAALEHYGKFAQLNKVS